MLSNFRVGITCTNPTILQRLANILQEPWCKIAEENGEYFWSSSLFETLSNGSEVANKADQYLPAFNGLVHLHLGIVPKIVRSNKISFFDSDSGKTGAYFGITISIPARINLSGDEEEHARRIQRWSKLVKTWTMQEINSLNALNNALTHFGEETNWNSLYNVYETIKEDYNFSQNVTHKRNYLPLPEQWVVIDERNREKDFTESANNAYISGIVSARHSLAASDRAEKIEGSKYIEITRSNGKQESIFPMSLGEAKEFVASILSQWILSKQVLGSNEHE